MTPKLEHRIERATASGGELILHDEPISDRCGVCGREHPIGVIVTTPNADSDQPIALDAAVCATCIAHGLALIFGRQHVMDGGEIADLALERGDSTDPATF